MAKNTLRTQRTANPAARLSATDLLLLRQGNQTQDSVALGSDLTNFVQPTPSGRLVTMGDSITNFSLVGGLSGTYGWQTTYHQRGFYNWLQALVGYPFSHTALYRGSLTPYVGNNAGIQGDWTKDNIARFDRDVTPQRGDVGALMIGTNDVYNNVTQITVSSNIRQLIQKFLGLGIKNLLVLSIPPRNNLGGLALSAPQEAVRLAVNADTAAYCAQFPNRIAFYNMDAVLIDPGTGLFNTAYSQSDGVHPNPLGAYTIALNFLLLWYQAVAGTARIPRSTADDYNSSTAPNGNIITNSEFTGTSGTKGSPITGTVPTSWSASRDIGSTVTGVASIVSQPDWNGNTKNFTQFVYTAGGAGAAGEAMSFRPAATITTGVVAGQWYEGEVEVILPAGGSTGTDPIEAPYIQVTDATATNGQTVWGFGAKISATDTFPTPTGGLRLLLRTPPIQAASAAGFNLTLFTRCDGTKVGTVTVQWGKPELRLINGPALSPQEVFTTVTATTNQTVSGMNNTVDIAQATPTAITIIWNPIATPFQKARLVIKDKLGNAGTTNYIIVMAKSGLIDGAASIVLNSAYQSISLTSDGLTAQVKT